MTMQPEGMIAAKSETGLMFEDKKAARPIIHRLRDHSEEVQPKGAMSVK